MRSLVEASSTGAGVEFDLLEPFGHFAQQATLGASTKIVLRLEGSLDGANWSAIGSSTFVSSTQVKSLTGPPVTFVRQVLTLKSGGGVVNGYVACDDQAISATVTANIGIVDTELREKDLNTSTGADLQAAVGLLGASATGAKIIEGSTGFGLEVDVTRVASLPLPSGAATEATLQNVRRGLTDQETRLDYSTRSDGNPVYVGRNLNAASTSANTWTIQRLSYDASARLTRAQVLSAVAWSSRANLAW